MSEQRERKESPSLARRHFLGIAAAAARRVGAVAALSSLPIIGSSAPANATPVPCFLRGTNILTSKGEARVEDLRIGDRVITDGGEAMPVKWVGRNFFKKAGAARSWPKNVQPIRVSRFA